MPEYIPMDRNLALEVVRVTEALAVESTHPKVIKIEAICFELSKDQQVCGYGLWCEGLICQL